jgi:hypothetical protein
VEPSPSEVWRVVLIGGGVLLILLTVLLGYILIKK